MTDECRASPSASWTCPKCTFINDGGPSSSDVCAMCEGPRPAPNCSNAAPRALPPEKIDLRAAHSDAVPSSTPIPSTATSIRFADSEVEEGRRRFDFGGRHSFREESIRLADLECDSDGDDSEKETKEGGGSSRLGDSAAARSIRSSELEGSDRFGSSLAALHNMSFAAWESDRTSWTCPACTFLNEPRFLVCGACGMEEGGRDSLSSAGARLEEEDNAGDILPELRSMSLRQAQDHLMDCIRTRLDSQGEDRIRHEKAVEILEEQIREGHHEAAAAALEGGSRARRDSEASRTARRHIETLERIQRAERGEHEEMMHSLAGWRAALSEAPDTEQVREMERREEELSGLLAVWEEREGELRTLRSRLEGNSAVL